MKIKYLTYYAKDMSRPILFYISSSAFQKEDIHSRHNFSSKCTKAQSIKAQTQNAQKARPRLHSTISGRVEGVFAAFGPNTISCETVLASVALVVVITARCASIYLG